MGTMCGVRRVIESLRVQGLGLPWLGSKSRCRGGGGVGVLEDANQADASAAVSWF
jgi:hypothetical protein